MFSCPYCAKPLNTWAVLASGSLAPRICPACGKQYFGGGGATSTALLFSGFAVAFAFGPESTQPIASFVLSVGAGLLLSLGYGLRSKAMPIESRWRDLAASAAVVLVFASLITGISLTSYGTHGS